MELYLENKIFNKFKNILKKEGLKVTHQRLLVLDEVVKDLGHRESEEIYIAINQSDDSISRATVYRTLDLLVKNKFIRKLNLGDGRARYESKFNSTHHDHMVCNQCGIIIEFTNNEIEELQKQVALNFDFKLQSHILQLFGICRKCQD